MSGYFITHFTVTDATAYDRYVEAVVPTIHAHNGKVLVATDDIEVIEGDMAHGRVVVVEFPSVAEAGAWQASPEYRNAAQIRDNATQTRSMILVAGFEPPAP
ncbi:MAG: DUF1330 domain-containing protein [Actinobacteria bacterium]|nr:DUF1330 domain-containing protein [Actinomycetota bacterium]